jgi:ferredoxin, 2Fe-2S
MSSLIVIDREGRERTLQAATGCSLMEALRDAGVGVAAMCGGVMSCGTCHVYVDDDSQLWPPSEDEAAMTAALSKHEPGRSRLACQIPVGVPGQVLRITVAPEE